MHFAALVALAVVASSILGLAAPVPNSHLQVTSKRDGVNSVNIHPYVSSAKRSSDRVLDSVTTKRDEDSIKNKRSTPLPAEGVHGTGSDDNQGITSNTGRRSADSGFNITPIWEWEGTNSNKDEVTEGTRSDDTKRFPIPDVYNVKPQPESIVISKEDGTTEGTTKRQVIGPTGGYIYPY